MKKAKLRWITETQMFQRIAKVTEMTTEQLSDLYDADEKAKKEKNRALQKPKEEVV